MMHILLEEKKLNPLIAIERISKFFTNYKYLDINDGSGSNSVLIDEDLFCYIVEKYDGLSRMMELSTTTEKIALIKLEALVLLVQVICKDNTE